MAIITSPGYSIQNAGVAVNGGKFRVYEQNTTTLATLYSDAAMTTPRANPVVANSAGELPFFFLADGAYDCAQLDASDNLLDSQDDVPAWGETSGVFSRTLPGNGRIKITGDAGAVMIQAGDPDPDNVGGSLTIEGQAGTQLDTLTLDAAAVNAGTSAGALKENSKKLAGVVSTEATTFTAASTVDIELTNSPTGVRAWEVEIFDFVNSGATVTLGLLFSYDGGATYKAGASDYAYGLEPYYATGGSTLGTAVRDDAAAFILLNQTPLPIVTANRHWLHLDILTVNSGTEATLVRSDLMSADDNTPAYPRRALGAGYGRGGYGRATHVRVYIQIGAGTLTGKYLLRPKRGYGEA